MASSSRAAAPAQVPKPDVFVSFRGEDTRGNFISHFRSATEKKGIFAFTDEGLRGGDDISDTLINKISESRVSVVIFSPNYANSRWCLDELVHIVHCKQHDGQMVLPVFLKGVKPTHVRHQTGPFGDGFDMSVARFPDKKTSWIHSLRTTADLSSGVYDHSSETEIIDQLINRILSVLGTMTSYDYHDTGFFGKERIEKVKSLMTSQDVNSIGIWGMGGSGKTTIARKVLAHISNNFDGACFLENVREHAKKGELNQLQEHLLSKLLGKGQPNEPPHTTYNNTTMFRLSRISVLIVLDDVTDAGQIDAVIGDWRNYGRGSKMITTSRNKQVLNNACDIVYEVQTLENSDALQLLQHHMFKQRTPSAEQMELLRQTIYYAKGLPLVLKVLGRNLHDKDITFWRSELEKLSDNPDLEIMNILRTSFDGLNDMEKSMFLDIACLLHCWDGDHAEIVLGACGFYPSNNIHRLIDKALISINQCNQLIMHDSLQQMGNEIGKNSRLWRPKDIVDVLSENMESDEKSKIEVISSDLSGAQGMIKLKPNFFKQTPRLRILRLLNNNTEAILLPQGLKYLPSQLRYLEWDKYHLPSFLPDFDLKNLVGLHMRGSNLSQLWIGKAYLPNLKSIDLNGSKMLRELPDLSGALKLEILEVYKCCRIQDIPGSVKQLVELKRLVLGFTGLTRFPELSELKKLEYLCLHGCWKIKKLPQLPLNLIELILSETEIEELPPNIVHLSQLTQLRCRRCLELESLPSNIGELKHLEKLDISGCSQLWSLPRSVGNLQSLVELRAYESSLIFSPEFKFPDNLQILDLSNCINLDSLPETIKSLANLEALYLSGCVNLESLPEGINCLVHLKQLYLSNCICLVSLPEGLKGLDHLEILDLSRCTNLESLPDGIEGLNHLKILYLSHCTSLASLPESFEGLAHLEVLDLGNCTNLESLPEGIKGLDHLQILDLSNCTRLERLPEGIKFLTHLEKLQLYNCTNFACLPEGIEGLVHLQFLNLSNCTNLQRLPKGIKGLVHLEKFYLSNCINLEELPKGFTCLVNLEQLDLSNCSNLVSLPEGLKDLDHLKILNLSRCTNLESLPEGIKGLAHLEELDLSHCTSLESLPDGIEGLANLKKLDLSYCANVACLPECIEGLSHLELLNLSNCTDLHRLPVGIKDLVHLEKIYLSNCINLEGLPEEIEGLIRLQILDLSNCTNLVSLPDGIEGLANLKRLDLSNCACLQSLPEGIKCLSKLEQLNFSNCPSLRILPELPSHLEYLDLSNCASLVKYTPMSSPNPDCLMSFCFWNCISLRGDARNQILRDFGMTISVLKVKEHKVELWLPGRELPAEWFNDDSVEMGCSFSVKTSWSSVGDPAMALLFGVVLAFSPTTNSDSSRDGLRVECQWRSESGHVLWSGHVIWSDSRNHNADKHISIPGEHLVVWLDVFDLSMFCFPGAAFQFYVSSGSGGLRDDVEILVCGVTPMIKKLGGSTPFIEFGASWRKRRFSRQ